VKNDIGHPSEQISEAVNALGPAVFSKTKCGGSCLQTLCALTAKATTIKPSLSPDLTALPVDGTIWRWSRLMHWRADLPPTQARRSAPRPSATRAGLFLG
jgi:hypothetical protein